MTNLEARVLRIEGEFKALKKALEQLTIKVGKLAQNAFSPGTGQGGGGTSLFPLICVLTGAISAAGVPGVGSPAGPLANQEVWSVGGSGFTSISTTADIYNGLPNSIVTGASCIVLPNADGSYTVIAVAC